MFLELGLTFLLTELKFNFLTDVKEGVVSYDTENFMLNN